MDYSKAADSNFATPPFEGFTNYLLSEEHSVRHRDHMTVCQDMTRPLSHYYIATSHNTWVLEMKHWWNINCTHNNRFAHHGHHDHDDQDDHRHLIIMIMVIVIINVIVIMIMIIIISILFAGIWQKINWKARAVLMPTSALSREAANVLNVSTWALKGCPDSKFIIF